MHIKKEFTNLQLKVYARITTAYKIEITKECTMHNNLGVLRGRFIHRSI